MNKVEKVISAYEPRGEVKQIVVDFALYPQGDMGRPKSHFNVACRLFSETGDTNKLSGLFQLTYDFKDENRDATERRAYREIQKYAKLRWGNDIQFRKYGAYLAKLKNCLHVH